MHSSIPAHHNIKFGINFIITNQWFISLVLGSFDCNLILVFYFFKYKKAQKSMLRAS